MPKQLDLLIVTGHEQPGQRFTSRVARECLASLRDGPFDGSKAALDGGDRLRRERVLALRELLLEIAYDSRVFVLQRSQARRQRRGGLDAGHLLHGSIASPTNE